MQNVSLSRFPSPKGLPTSVFYQWKSSLSETLPGARKMRRRIGALGARSTLDFLKETQGYINRITQPKPGLSRSQPHSSLKGSLHSKCRVKRYWELSSEDIKFYHERSRVVYRWPLHSPSSLVH